ncbi:hypothetical protein LCGC14_0478150 [marine sediment metagenome]|uniref:Uncharacterized protein n=1 Tax=marine sediment metagenome TaxID=412755 RepID=A0A0F9SA70_9ZZZZ
MADWDDPELTSTYADFLSKLKARDVDAACLKESSSNTPTGYIQWVVASNKFQRWSGSAWVDLVLSVAGGGTAGVVALGTMAFQNSNAVAISAGTIAGLTTFEFACDLIPDGDETRNLGSDAKKIKKAYIGEGLVIPVGVDKWVTA